MEQRKGMGGTLSFNMDEEEEDEEDSDEECE